LVHLAGYTPRVRVLLILGLLAAPVAARGDPVLQAPKKVSKAELERFLTDRCEFQMASTAHRFHAGGWYAGTGIMGARMNGKWKVRDRSVIVDSRGNGGPCGDGDCSRDWSGSFRWADIEVSPRDFILTINSSKVDGVFMRCDPGVCKGGKGSTCVIEDAWLIRPGAKDRGRFERTKAHLAKAGLQDVVLVEGPPTKHRRKASQVWFQVDEGPARKAAAKLAPVIGPAEVKRWEWGGAYEMIIIVGP